MEFVAGFSPARAPTEPWIVVLGGGRVLQRGEGPWRPLRRQDLAFAGNWWEQHWHFLGYYSGEACVAVILSAELSLPENYHWQSPRALIAAGAIEDSAFAAVASGLQVLNWDRSHRFCGRCGSPTRPHGRERARVCENCEFHFYPRISPCVIGLITDGDRCLLARHGRSRGNFFAPLAGFIEPGESAEEALHREVGEEVAVAIGMPRYFGSQPWPFPGQLMLGFHASYTGGQLRVDGEEIMEAHWCHYDSLPPVPPAGTLSGRLIRHFVESQR